MFQMQTFVWRYDASSLRRTFGASRKQFDLRRKVFGSVRREPVANCYVYRCLTALVHETLVLCAFCSWASELVKTVRGVLSRVQRVLMDVLTWSDLNLVGIAASVKHYDRLGFMFSVRAFTSGF